MNDDRKLTIPIGRSVQFFLVTWTDETNNGLEMGHDLIPLEENRTAPKVLSLLLLDGPRTCLG